MFSDQADVVNGAIETYGDEIRAFVGARLHYDMVDDLLQELWIRLGKTLENQTIKNIRAWLYAVVRNLITDTYRQSSMRPTFVDLDVDMVDSILAGYAEEEEETGNDEYFWERLDEALDNLPKNQRVVFIRNELEGETLLEIARDLGENLKTIISRKQYAKRKLQSALSDIYDDYYYFD